MWNKVYVHLNQIEYETAKAKLIKLPNKSSYKGWMFWHPSSLIELEYGGNMQWFEVIFPDTWEFTFVKGKQRKKMDIEDVLDAYESTTDRIQEQEAEWKESYYRETEPKKINLDVGVDESLLR